MKSTLLALFIALPVATSADIATGSPAQDWPQTCRHLAADDPPPAIRLTPRPQHTPDTTRWRLHWQGQSIPIPEADYRELRVLGRQGGVIELLLHGGGITVALFHSAADAPVDGKPYSLAQALLAAYQGQAVTCAAERQAHDDMALSGRRLARIASPFQTDAIHPAAGQRPGWVETGPRGNSRHWRAISLGHASQPGTQIELITPDTATYAHIGLEIDAPEAPGSSSAPPWLAALQRALDHDTPAAWRELRQQLSRHGVSHQPGPD